MEEEKFRDMVSEIFSVLQSYKAKAGDGILAMNAVMAIIVRRTYQRPGADKAEVEQETLYFFLKLGLGILELFDDNEENKNRIMTLKLAAEKEGIELC